jgi:hypothetical protein
LRCKGSLKAKSVGCLFCSSLCCLCSTAVCAATWRLCSTAAWAPPGHVCSTSFCTASGCMEWCRTEQPWTPLLFHWSLCYPWRCLFYRSPLLFYSSLCCMPLYVSIPRHPVVPLDLSVLHHYVQLRSMDLSVLLKPVLPLNVIQQSVTPFDVFVLPQPALPLAMSVLWQSELPGTELNCLDVSVLQQPVRLPVGAAGLVCSTSACAALWCVCFKIFARVSLHNFLIIFACSNKKNIFRIFSLFFLHIFRLDTFNRNPKYYFRFDHCFLLHFTSNFRLHS